MSEPTKEQTESGVTDRQLTNALKRYFCPEKSWCLPNCFEPKNDDVCQVALKLKELIAKSYAAGKEAGQAEQAEKDKSGVQLAK